MRTEFTPDPGDRLLLLAPHPDDESLAAGGLLALAARRGAAVRVLYVTRGENNPWTQRVVEGRLRVGPQDRLRWAEKRWAETLAALACLGVPAGSAHCLGLPDQGLSELLLRGDASPVRALDEEFARWRPTVILAPAIWDGHPDHSALGLFTRFALGGGGAARGEGVGGSFASNRASAGSAVESPAPLTLQYVVHRRTEPAGSGLVRVPLDERLRHAKREAILSHRSQALLRRKFLLRFVGAEERFTPLESWAADNLPHPIRSAALLGGTLALDIARPLPPGLGRPEILLVAEAGGAGRTDGDGERPPGHVPPWTALRVDLDLVRRRGILRVEGGDPVPLPLQVGPKGFRIGVPLPTRVLGDRAPARGPAGLDPARAGGAEPAVYANVIRPGMRRLGFFDAVGFRVAHAPLRPPGGGVRGTGEAVPEQEDARMGANSLAGVVAAQGFEPRTKGL